MMSHLSDPLMWDPFLTKMDPFSVFDSDPFFRPLHPNVWGTQQRLGNLQGQQQGQLQGQQQQQGLLNDTEMNKDSSALTAPTTGTNVGNVGGSTGNNVGFWNFNRYLNEPLTLGLEDLPDKYVMNIIKPTHIGDHDLKIDIKNDILTVHGEKSSEKRDTSEDGKASSYKFASTSFSRSIRLPHNVDQGKIMAHMEQPGRLLIELPKIVTEKTQLKQIPINRANVGGGNVSGTGNVNIGTGGGENVNVSGTTGSTTTGSTGTAHNLRHKK